MTELTVAAFKNLEVEVLIWLATHKLTNSTEKYTNQ